MSPSISERACSKSLPGRQEPLWCSSKPPKASLFKGYWAGWLHLMGPPLTFFPVSTELTPHSPGWGRCVLSRPPVWNL